MALTLKQRRFIDAYLGEANGNATAAARIAGYKDPEQAGYENKRKQEVLDEIARLYAANTMPAEEVLARLTDQARGPSAYIRHLANGKPFVDTEAMQSERMGHLIKGIKYTDKGQCIIEFYDAQSALALIGKHYKLFHDVLDHAGVIAVKAIAEVSESDL